MRPFRFSPYGSAMRIPRNRMFRSVQWREALSLCRIDAATFATLAPTRSGRGHVDRNTTAPREAGPEHLRQLADAGLGPYDIVSLSQVIAFVSYQVRLVAALAALEQAS
jgi:hypothetical protein